MFQVTQYKTCQILVQTFRKPWSSGSPSVFHFRNRQRFQVPGFEWVHELWLFCLASNPAQFCAEISCGKTGLGHIFKLSDSRKKIDSRDSGVGRDEGFPALTTIDDDDVYYYNSRIDALETGAKTLHAGLTDVVDINRTTARREGEAESCGIGDHCAR